MATSHLSKSPLSKGPLPLGEETGTRLHQVFGQVRGFGFRNPVSRGQMTFGQRTNARRVSPLTKRNKIYFGPLLRHDRPTIDVRGEVGAATAKTLLLPDSLQNL